MKVSVLLNGKYSENVNNIMHATIIANNLQKIVNELRSPSLELVDKSVIAPGKVDTSLLHLEIVGDNKKQYHMVLLVQNEACDNDFFKKK